MAYTKGAGAKAVAGYGVATRDVTATEKMWEGIESLWGSAQDVGASIALKKEEADTAWGEYETVYEALGGKDFKRPEWGDEGFFKSRFSGPEGEVRIGDSMYDRSKIQEAGSFLGSDAAAELDVDARTQYLERTAPGREIKKPSSFVPQWGPSSGQRIEHASAEGQAYLESPEYKTYARTGQMPVFKHGADSDRLKMETELAGWEAHDVARGQLETDIRRDEQDQFLQDYRTDYKEQQKTAWGDYMANPPALSPMQQKSATALNKFRGVQSYARGGDFITNGPQEILVGDNPGGRERVTIKPLPSKNDEEYKKRNLLESLYENNRRRKVY
mgnify:CR=1 FL=1